ncbi:MAG TPA: glycoside hydrolase [Spirochaetaceae bacterium]|jgi:1,4-alpha-glucan branching enzyme|nr:glycoside hydrolase [Spirochaetaceae bacterium]
MLKKDYGASSDSCRVTFTLKQEEAAGAHEVFLVGDFNNWNPAASPMHANVAGNFELTIALLSGHEYQYRFFLDGLRWENDWNADKYVGSPYGTTENSVVIV